MSQPPPPHRAVVIVERVDGAPRSANRADRSTGLEIILGPAAPIVRALQATIRRYSDYERLQRAAW
jgi:hypothetical protein